MHMSWTPGRWVVVTIIVLVALGGRGRAAAGQERRVEAVVQQIAGATLYLSVGSEAGLAVNDTLAVSTADGRPLGSFLVLGATPGRSVVTFADTPFPVTRGQVLALVAGLPAEIPPESMVGRSETPGVAQRDRGPRLSGRVSLQVSDLRSAVEWLGGSERIERHYLTPTFGLRATVSDLPGGITFNTNVRASYRSSTEDAVQPIGSVRMYQASLRKTFTGTPVQMQVGRFYNPFEQFSGYWDGLMVHYGGPGLGLGFATGFEPERSNEYFLGDLPKYAVFLTYGSGGTAGYSADLSFHQVRPRTELATHTFVGWSQQLAVAAFRLDQRLQLDRNPETDRWVVTDLQAGASASIAPGVEVRARYSLRQPYLMYRTSDLVPYRRDRAGAGFTVHGPAGSIGADVTVNYVDLSDRSITYSSSFYLPRTIAGIAWSGSASYWTRNETNTVLAASGVSRQLGPVRATAAYQFHRTAGARSTFLTHAADVTLAFPLARRLRGTLLASAQQGDNLVSYLVSGGLWMSF